MQKKPPEFESLEQMSDATATALTQAAANSAFRLFRDRQFRRAARFERLGQTEQDRIFNELVVSFIALLLLILEAPDLRIEPDLRDYLKIVHKAIPSMYLTHLKSIGVQTQHLRDWETLLSMRHEEYARDRHEVRAAAMQMGSNGKNLDLDELSKIQILLPVQTVAIGCHHHLCRGETAGLDDLFKLILKSLTPFYVEVRGRFEGRQATPLKRAQLVLRRIVERLSPKGK